MLRKMSVLGVCVAVTAVMTSCGSSDSSSGDVSSSSDAASGDSPAVDFNDADVMFAQMMIPHHEQAIELADIALDPAVGASDAVRALAQRIKEAQDPEIDQMTTLLGAWGESTEMDSDMDHSTMMSGMLTLDELATLSDQRGTDFDQAWLEAMISHHEGAIEMANDVLDDGSNTEIRSLAEQIIAAQQTEIDEMRALLG